MEMTWRHHKNRRIFAAVMEMFGIRGNLLRCANFKNADLSRADLRGMNFVGADMRGVNLTGSDLSGATMKGANMIGADLRGADFTGAKMQYTNLTHAQVEGTNFSGADMRGSIKRYVNREALYLGYEKWGMPDDSPETDIAELTLKILRRKNHFRQ